MFSLCFPHVFPMFPMFPMDFPMFFPCFPRQPGTTFRLGGSEAADSASRLVRQAAHEKGKAKAAERLGRAFLRRCDVEAVEV
jgi:hypothetical protein